MNEEANSLGVEMRKQAEANGNCTRQVGTLFLHLTRDGHDSALELNDETPIPPEVATHWLVEVGAPGGARVYKGYGGKVWRFEWIDNKEEVAAQRAETVAFFLHGGKP